MSKRTAITMLSILSVIGLFYYLLHDFRLFGIDEERILKESRAAFQQMEFKQAPFRKKEQIWRFANFLLRHNDEIRTYNQHNEYRDVQLAEGMWKLYENNGDCFEMPTFHPTFVCDYIPSDLVDSLNHYSNGVRASFITGFTLCGSGYRKNTIREEGSVSFRLKYERKDRPQGSYYLFHTLDKNRSFKLQETIESVYDDDGLARDTILTDGMKYTIRIYPYRGL
ncbi:MAG: hypothetical protein AAFY48_11720 [Bacteroidota bacterium]